MVHLNNSIKKRKGQLYNPPVSICVKCGFVHICDTKMEYKKCPIKYTDQYGTVCAISQLQITSLIECEYFYNQSYESETTNNKVFLDDIMFDYYDDVNETYIYNAFLCGNFHILQALLFRRVLDSDPMAKNVLVNTETLARNIHEKIVEKGNYFILATDRVYVESLSEAVRTTYKGVDKEVLIRSDELTKPSKQYLELTKIFYNFIRECLPSMI